MNVLECIIGNTRGKSRLFEGAGADGSPGDHPGAILTVEDT